MIQPDIRARQIGQESCPIAVIDGFSPDPERLRATAMESAFASARDHYPGVRAAVPDDYVSVQGTLLARVLKGIFGATGPARILDVAYAIVSTPAPGLSLVQRLPHIDAMSPDRIALVHYLSPGASEGTAFFRHRSTGFETVDAERSGPYLAALDAEARTGLAPAEGYMASDNAIFERTHVVKGAFNRAVIYRSNMLHSGAITGETPLSPDPAVGRLTITGFLALS